MKMMEENKKHEILFNDVWYVIASKPNGMPTVPDPSGDESLKQILEKEVKTQLFPINRIDRPVSGLCLFAKYKEAAGDLSKMLAEGKVQKTYLAIVEGIVPTENGVLEDVIAVDKNKNKAYSDEEMPQGKKAISKYKVVAYSDRYTLLKVEPITGRQHQIRFQLSNFGFPIKGDVKYMARRKNPDRSISLLSYQISFDHPYVVETVKVNAAIPDDTLWNFFKDDILKS